MEKIWLNQYPEGIPAQIDADIWQSIPEGFAQICSEFADNPAFSCMEQTLTFREIQRLSQDFANYLTQELKLEKGSRIALMMPNILQYPVALFGALSAGMTIVNVNPLYTSRELQHQLQDAGVSVIILLDHFAHVLETVIDQTCIQHVIVTSIADLHPFFKRLAINFTVAYVKKMVPDYQLPGTVSFRRALAKGHKKTFQPQDIQPQDLAFLQYTGGTTGIAKGAMLTHRNMIANMQQVQAWLKIRAQVGTEVILTPLPLYHVFSLTANCLVFMRFGAHNILIPNPRDLKQLIADMKHYQITAMTGVNTLFNALSNVKAFREVDFSRFKLTVGGGAAVQASVAKKWKQVTGHHILEGYGLTETSPVVCVVPPDSTDFTGSIGLPLPSVEISLRDDEGQEVTAQQDGELWVRGPQVMAGYWQRPDETAKTLTADGWLKTGDIARMDELGYVYIVDRKKDMILVAGFNVFPNEVETIVAEHEAVDEVACIGIPEKRGGEAVKIFVVLKPGFEVDAKTLKTHCQTHLTEYKVPKKIEFVQALPKSNIGKILRKELRNTGK
ncbi:AMP-binding protein [Candidatus Venteria ishoeyi]|uniref:AMP-binding protein n=1 Tax=Candidatus Venteria ishoeyi TaxID=1899563 RepID=UPI0025A68561|nr:AMP-binding protein [Candidatus Venteria ishoeyi]MDM8548318.1 AMP-binding protein [Candidatus Venteria ishoeyi]